MPPVIAVLRFSPVLLGLLIVVPPAQAQWTRIVDVPASDIFSVYASGDTIVAGADTATYVSTNAGATWKRSAKVTTGVTEIRAVLLRDGRIYAGTSRQGVFVSDDLGDTWLDFNQGLVGGIFNTQLDIEAFLVHGDSLYVATEGAGPWVRNLAGVGGWSHYGNLTGDTTAPVMTDIAASDTRLLSAGGGNGTVFFRDLDDADWTLSFLDNVGFVAGLGPISAAWTGHGFVVGSNGGLFRSPSGQEPWTPTGPDFGGPLFNVSFAVRAPDLFASIIPGGGSVIEVSHDDGATWQELETLASAFIYKLAANGTDLYAGRLDGLWRRSIEIPTSVEIVLLSTQVEAGQVRIQWEFNGGAINSAEVYRKSPDGTRTQLPPPTLEADGTLVMVDSSVSAGVTYTYRLVIHDATLGESSLETSVTVPGGREAPRALRLEPARPNPFRDRSELTYGLTGDGRVRLTVYDIHGRRVAVVVDDVEPAGWRSVEWDGRDSAGRPVGSGTYLLRLQSNGAVGVRKIVIAR
jgi:photosystem II stability/assembly factor-like uncharacterized protein